MMCIQENEDYLQKLIYEFQKAVEEYRCENKNYGFPGETSVQFNVILYDTALE